MRKEIHANMILQKNSIKGAWLLIIRRDVTLGLPVLEVDRYMLGILTSLERYVSVACECRLTILLNNLAV